MTSIGTTGNYLVNTLELFFYLINSYTDHPEGWICPTSSEKKITETSVILELGNLSLFDAPSFEGQFKVNFHVVLYSSNKF